MDTKVQKMINYVKANGPSRWTDIQRNVVCEGHFYSSVTTTRGWGCSGVWRCATKPARGRKEYIRKCFVDSLYRVWKKDDRPVSANLKEKNWEKVNTLFSKAVEYKIANGIIF